jgi:hypothetical protein
MRDLFLGIRSATESAAERLKPLQYIMPAYWEYVIILPNPDAVEKQACITEEAAIKIYKQ